MAKSWIKAKRLRMKVYREKARGIMKQFSSSKINCGRSVSKEGMKALHPKNAALNINSRTLSYNLDRINEPRQAVLELREKIKNAEPLRYFRLLDDAFARARLYYSDNPEFCYILELDRRTKVHRRSIRYLSRDIAYGRYCDGSIDWSPEFHHDRIPETFGA